MWRLDLFTRNELSVMHSYPPEPAHESQRRLTLALSFTAAYCLIELAGGWITNSLALISDAGHMFADVAALGGSLFALRLAQRPPDESKTFGYHRAEILAAFVSGLGLWLLVGLIFQEAYHRLWNPPVVRSAAMIAIAAVGLAVNLASLLVLRRSHADNLNLRAAFVHVCGDALGSVAAILGAVLMLAGGWYVVDPMISIAIGLLILYTSWSIVRESAEILMQGAPRELRLPDIESCLHEIAGVVEVHDLHVWTLTSGRYLLSVHLVVCDGAPPRSVIDAAQQQLHDRFGIGHATVQIDHEEACEEQFRAH